MDKLSEGLKKYRIKKGYTQKDIADAIGVSQSAYALYEKGHRTPPIDKLAKISDFLVVSIAELLQVENEVVKLEPDRIEELILIEFIRKYSKENPGDKKAKLYSEQVNLNYDELRDIERYYKYFSMWAGRFEIISFELFNLYTAYKEYSNLLYDSQYYPALPDAVELLFPDIVNYIEHLIQQEIDYIESLRKKINESSENKK